MSLSTTINYDTEGNFTQDNTKTEFVGSLVRLKDQRPVDITFGHSFGQLDATWADGSKTHTVIGATPTLVANRLVMNSNDLRALSFPATTNMVGGQTGAIDFILKPNYSGNPGSNRTFFDVGPTSLNRVSLQHLNGSVNLQYIVYDSAGTPTATLISFWNPAAGVEYRFQVNWDLTVGASSIFIDGVQLGSTSPSTGTRIAPTTNLFIGTDSITPSDLSNFEIGSFKVYPTVQNTANYTPGPELPFTVYPLINPTIVINSPTILDEVFTFVEVKSVTGSDDVKYTLNFAGVEYFWSGIAWIVSDATYAQSNTAAEINTNGGHSTLPEGSMQLTARLHSDDGSTRPTLTSNVITYSFFNTQVSPPVCTIWGFYRDASGAGVSGANVTFELIRTEGQYREAGDAIIEKKITVTTDANGRFESDLIRTSAFEAAGNYLLTIKKTADKLSTTSISSGVNLVFSVPDATDENITDLLTSVA